MPRPLHVFLCHASQDKPAVRELYNLLKDEGWIDPWLDKAKILPGQDWEIVVEKAVDESDVVIACLSNQSVSKEGFVQREIRYAYDMALEKPEDTIFLIPLRLDDCIVPRKLRTLHWVDYFGSDKEDSYSDLLEALRLRYEQKLNLEADELKRKKAEKEAENKEKEKQERIAAEIKEKERSAREKEEKEKQERIAVEMKEKERSAREKEGKEKQERTAAELKEKERLARKKTEKEKQERIAAELKEKERLAREKEEKEKQERIAAELKEKERSAREKEGKIVSEKEYFSKYQTQGLPSSSSAKTSKPSFVFISFGILLFLCTCSLFFWWVDATTHWCTFFPFISGC